jgi:hypothetical protein
MLFYYNPIHQESKPATPMPTHILLGPFHPFTITLTLALGLHPLQQVHVVPWDSF